MVDLFIILLVCGLLLVGAEVFVPGGIVGGIGGLCLLIAAIMGFAAFGPLYGFCVAVGIVLLVGVAILMWIKLFPRSSIGKEMIVARSLSGSSATDSSLSHLLGREGTAASELRPSGFALIDGQRVDVVTEGGMILKDERVRVIHVEGNRAVVARVNAPGKSNNAGA